MLRGGILAHGGLEKGGLVHGVVFQDPATTRQALEALDRKPPRYVLAPRRLSAPERHGLYTGLERRSQVLLLEPRDARVDHLANPDLLALARGIRAESESGNASGDRSATGGCTRIADCASGGRADQGEHHRGGEGRAVSHRLRG